MIMKKYMTPRVEIVNLEAESMLASSPTLNDKVSDAEALSNKRDIWDSDLWGTEVDEE